MFPGIFQAIRQESFQRLYYGDKIKYVLSWAKRYPSFSDSYVEGFIPKLYLGIEPSGRKLAINKIIMMGS